jgi:glycosyltransferase involved in cell wall biosynthesis
MSADFDFSPPACAVWYTEEIIPLSVDRWRHPAKLPRRPTPEFLRRCAWEIGEQKLSETYVPPACQVGLAMINPCQGFAHWRILPEWIDQVARQKGDTWHNCRMILRLYDVSWIIFNGFNAHQMRDFPLGTLCGQMIFNLGRPGTSQLAEVGFLLHSGEFVPAARSQVTAFAPDAPSRHGSPAALLVTPRGRIEEIGNLWDQERILWERRRPRLRQRLRIAVFAWPTADAVQNGLPTRFITELVTGQVARGHDIHVFVPACNGVRNTWQRNGVHYHPLVIPLRGTPVERALAFGQAGDDRLQDLPPFDLIHAHEWMSGPATRGAGCPTVLSLTSVESTRRNGTPPSSLSREVEQAERAVAHAADLVLTPSWLRPDVVATLGLDASRVHPFPMEGRLENEWERPLDYGRVKQEIGFGPLDRLILFVGPLEYAAGVDLLLEAMPVLLQRVPNLRFACLGAGFQYGQLAQQAQHLGLGYALRLLGHMEGPQVTRLMRAAEALVLPSRYRVPMDDAVVDLARKAGRPVVTTHGGPAHLVRHEETGLVTYDNPGSMVWALDRILGDPGHAERMGRHGHRRDTSTPCWGEMAQNYLELCATCFPQLTEMWE